MSTGGKPDIRSFFGKPAGAKPAAGGPAAGATAGTAPAAAAPPSAPVAAGGVAKTTPAKQQQKATPAKRPAADAEVVVLDDSDDELVVAPKRARVAAAAVEVTPSPAKKRARQPTSSNPKSAKKVATPKPTYPRPILPPEEELKFSLTAEGQGWGGGARAQPPSASSLLFDELPRGPDDCLSGETFVFTGNLPRLSRTDADSFVKRHGGRVTQDVSSKTSYLVVGADSGQSKYGKAKANSVKLIDEDGLLSLVAACAGLVQQPAAPRAPAPAPVRAPAAQAGPSRAPAAAGRSASASDLWVEKHKPKTPADLVGNGKFINDLRQWLQSWHSKNTGPKPAVKPKAQDAPKKAVLMSGPPGIGKTSSAKIICATLGFDVMEVNASDARGKSDADVKGGMGGKMANIVKEMVTNTAVNFDGTPKRQVLIMDEVDGMSSGDRGGVADLIDTIKVSKIPIICICNDAWSQKLRSLKNHCLELKFARPTKQMIRGRMMKIAQQEGLEVSETAMEALIEQCRSDIRLVLNTLQMRRLNADTLRFDDVRAIGTKDLELGAFSAADGLMQPDNSRYMSINDRMNLVYQDSDIIPLFIQENYVNMRPDAARSDQHRMELLADAGCSISDGDVLNTAVRRHQRWNLMPYAVVMSSVTPTSILRGRRQTLGLFPGEHNFNRFPAWLGKNSSTGKQRRIVGEVQAHTLVSGVCFANRSAIREEYMPTLRLALTAPMFGTAAGGREKEGIPAVMELMNEYCLTRDDWEALLDITRIKAEGVADVRLKDPLALIPTAVKSAFTRACNDKTRDVKSGLMLQEFKKSKAKKKGKEDEDEELDEDEEEGGADEEEPEEEAETDIKKMKALAKRGLNINLKGGEQIEGKEKSSKGKGKTAGKAVPKSKK